MLLDLLMPRLDGYGFLKSLRAEKTLKRLPVIVITAKSHEREAVVADELVITREVLAYRSASLPRRFARA